MSSPADPTAPPLAHRDDAAPPPALPPKNPSYPPRTHYGEKAQLAATLKSWDEKIAGVARKLATLRTDQPNRASFERAYYQMLGARDQMADAIRRMPLEAGDLYHEDQERLKNAEAALSRLMSRWDTAGR
ncbi:hypothetical protein OJF2_13400 [Aquisphaera giovannonii]|uniref:Uncharacterized protein n=1 Tax=Aquisphaera giovannonii TaxID=406548 RepID=A0A5B9VYP1_9BACT|nr:hypothetical protein [Aquisphaera giovannonii]QEH32855.1 hypothetical protein OJF2_13400 [Aquisphaera giovannonii]